MKNFWTILRFIIENVPNIGFWFWFIYVFKDWYLSQQLFVKIVFILIPTGIVTFTLLHNLRKVRKQLIENSAKAALIEKKAANNKDQIKSLIRNIPSKKELISIYDYATDYAKSWASDGKVDRVCFYIDLNENKLSKSAQIFIFSSLRKELLTTYLPNKSFDINEDESISQKKEEISLIYSFSNWKEAVKKTLEISASNIEKADIVRLQISPRVNSLSINLYLEKKNRKWTQRFILEKNKLLKDNKDLYVFD